MTDCSAEELQYFQDVLDAAAAAVKADLSYAAWMACLAAGQGGMPFIAPPTSPTGIVGYAYQRLKAGHKEKDVLEGVKKILK